MHGIPLPQGHYAVCIDHFKECTKLLRIPIPISSVDINTVEDAHGTYVAWPFKWVQFGDDVLQKFAHAHKSDKLSKGKGNELSKGKGNELSIEKGKELSKEKGKEQSNEKGKKELVKAKSSKGSAPEPLIEPLTELVSRKVLFSFSESCNWLHTCAMGLPLNGTVKVDVEPSMLNHFTDISQVYLSREEFSEFLAGHKLSASIITTFMRILNDELKKGEQDSRVGWLCPLSIRGDRCMKEKSKVREYILGSFKKYREQTRDLIIAPYLQAEHWLLIVVTPANNTVYVFDFVAQDPPRMLLVKNIMNNVWRELTGHREQASGRNFDWIYLKCAQQNDGEACGYYTMRNMNDLVRCALGVVNLSEVLNHTNLRPLTKDQINVVRDKFATFITDNFM